jgi:hypothetical protein
MGEAAGVRDLAGGVPRAGVPIITAGVVRPADLEGATRGVVAAAVAWSKVIGCDTARRGVPVGGFFAASAANVGQLARVLCSVRFAFRRGSWMRFTPSNNDFAATIRSFVRRSRFDPGVVGGSGEPLAGVVEGSGEPLA